MIGLGEQHICHKRVGQNQACSDLVPCFYMPVSDVSAGDMKERRARRREGSISQRKQLQRSDSPLEIERRGNGADRLGQRGNCHLHQKSSTLPLLLLYLHPLRHKAI